MANQNDSRRRPRRFAEESAIAAKSKSRLGVVVALVLLVAGTIALAYYLTRGREKSREGQYRLEAVDRGDVTMAVTATGTISAVTTVQVGSQVSGIIARLHADFNSPVKEGQLLAELDPAPFLAALEQRQADLIQAEVEARNAGVTLGRQQRLVDQGLVSRAEYDSAEAALDSAKARVEQTQAGLTQARTNLSYTKILSPIAGVVVARQYDIGQTVAASFQAPTLFTIAKDLTRMQVLADVDQSDIGRVELGQSAKFTVDAFPETEFHGTVTQVRLNATVNQNVVTYPVILEVANPELKLRPQMTADVSLEVATAKDVMRVPNAALRFRPTGAGSPARGRPGAAEGPRADPGGGRAASGAPGSAPPRNRSRSAGEGVAGAPGSRGMQTVHVLEGGELRAISIRTGISDGRFTEVTGGELAEGAQVVVGLVTTRAAPAPASQPFGGGGRRMF